MMMMLMMIMMMVFVIAQEDPLREIAPSFAFYKTTSVSVTVRDMGRAFLDSLGDCNL